MSAFPDLSDPHQFPIDYRAEEDVFCFLKVDLEELGRASFLDQRMKLSWEKSYRISSTSLSQLEVYEPPAFLFHTAFCGSTLLARALHAPPQSVSLKEPQALLSLSSAYLRVKSIDDAKQLDKRLLCAIALLSRPWSPNGKVLIKPTNQVNSLIPRILQMNKSSSAVFLYSDLKEFLLSCFKKLPEAETRIRWMAQHLLVDSHLAKELEIDPFHPFTFIESCVLAWYAQIERYAQALTADTSDRLRTLNMRSILAQPKECVRKSAAWLGLDATPGDLDLRVVLEFSRNAKSIERRYGNMERDIEKARVLSQHGAVIEKTLEWAKESIEPSAWLPNNWKPLLAT